MHLCPIAKRTKGGCFQVAHVSTRAMFEFPFDSKRQLRPGYAKWLVRALTCWPLCVADEYPKTSELRTSPWPVIFPPTELIPNISIPATALPAALL